MNTSKFALLLASLAAAAPVAAQTEQAVEPTADWQHSKTDLRLAPQIDEFTRDRVVFFDDAGYNLGATYQDESTGTTASFYLYRVGVESLPIWADRATTVIGLGKTLGKVDQTSAESGVFVPANGNGVKSGYAWAAPVSGTDFTSTVLLMYSNDGWLVKLRMSSRTLSPSQITARAERFLANVPTGLPTSDAPPFVPIEDCRDKLNITKAGKMVPLDISSILMLSAVMSAASERSEKELALSERDASVWCRESTNDTYSAYRENGSPAGYTVAFGNSGFVASVDYFDVGSPAEPPKGYLIFTSDGITKSLLPPFDQLPPIEQLVTVPGRTQPVSTIDVRPDGYGAMHITVPAQQ